MLATAGVAIAAAATLATGTTTAGAADLGGGPRYGGSIKDATPPVYDVPSYRYYLAVRGAATFPEDTEFNTATLGFSSQYEDGYAISGAAGVSGLWGVRGLRGELEVGYNSAEVSSQSVSGGGFLGPGAATGRTNTTFGLASLYYDFDTGSFLRPFVGVGGGIADVHFDNHGITPLGAVLDDRSTAYAFHFTGGVNMKITDSLNVEIAYRYFGTAGAELTTRDGIRNDIDVSDHQILLGLRQSF